MWTYINKCNIDYYINQYPALGNYWNQLNLFETNDAVFIPRLMYNNFPSHYLQQHLGKNIVTPQKTKIEFHGKLRPLQEDAATAFMKIYNKKQYCNGILKLFPGAGKTVLSAYLATQLGLKTCIVLDNTELLKQWIEEYLEFTNLTIDDIGIIQGKVNATNKPVTICMVQSLLSKLKKDFNKAFNEIDAARFGLVFYDECHNTTSSEKFAKASLLFRTLNVNGLSATPFQTGVHEILMKNTIGEVIYETNDYDLNPKYYFVYYDSGLGKSYGPRINKTFDFIKKKAFYNSIIIKSDIYIDLIQKYSLNLKNNGYNVMIVCITKNQVNAISEALTKRNVEHRRFYGDEREIDKINDNIVVTTYKFTGKGFNMKRLSALILACPLSGKKSIIQVVGRILRECVDKLDPVVVDLIDFGFPLMFMPDVKRKMGILSNEFKKCEIIQYKEI